MYRSQRLEQFWQRLSTAASAVLLLDYDGTLAPFQVARDQAQPYPGIREMLTAIRHDTATRLVIISGRAIDSLVPLLALEPPPEIWGCHGWERLDVEGRRPPVELPEQAAAGLHEADRWIEQAGLDGYCERKPVSLALHWRGLPAARVAELRAMTFAGWRPIAARNGLELHPFNGGLELRCPGRSKATAVLAILADHKGDVPIAFLGDDLTDEDGFAALAGRGLGVLVAAESRETHAELQIRPPDELIDFLTAWRDHAPRKGRATERELP